MRFVAASGLRIRVADAGTGGTPLVLIHGLAGSIEVWEPLLTLLAAERRTLATCRATARATSRSIARTRPTRCAA